MTGPSIGRLCVVGLGLLGGSVALAAKRRGVVSEVVGATRSEEARDRALREGVVDRIEPLATAAVEADLVVLATPVGAMAETLKKLAPGLKAGAIVTDVGSVKGALAETLPGLLPPSARYIGSHPMAGSHFRGVEHARADLLEGAVCVICAAPGKSTREALEAEKALEAFWEALGARVVRRTPEVHDAEVAWVSHLPHLLAFAFAGGLAEAPSAAAELAGGGFRDFTRIARSDPALWADILCSNRKALAGPMGAAAAALGDLARSLEAGDAEALKQLLSAARSALWAEPAARDAQNHSPEDPSRIDPGDPDTRL